MKKLVVFARERASFVPDSVDVNVFAAAARALGMRQKAERKGEGGVKQRKDEGGVATASTVQ